MSSLVSVLYREAFSHPYISFFHFLVIGFSVIGECGSTLYVGLAHALWHMRFCPLVQNSSRYFSRLKRVCRTQTLTSIEHHISSLHLHFWVQPSSESSFPQPDKKRKFLRFLHHQYNNNNQRVR